MKNFKHTALTTALVVFACIKSFSQAAKADLILNLGYYNNNNHIQYLKAITKAKIDGKFQMVPGIHLSFYITAQSPEHLLGKGITNDKGIAVLFIPPSAKDEWMKSSQQSFFVVSEASKQYDATQGEADVTKAKIKIDTADERKIVATLLALKDSVWVPVKGVDMKVAIKRLGGDLNVNESPTFTTDSLGMISADFKRDSLPGDSKGNLTLVAKVEDDDTYGNVTSEKIVPWGKAVNYVSTFDKRTLFARRGRSPIWLELMAYSIIAVVWGILLYLVGQLIKVKKLGT
ncbi:MAG TPA: hypothetical protein VG738_01105 [Chitinophagaceae bacterium]|nr:hypothetical protein [Chitinophagaceae bacterium]